MKGWGYGAGLAKEGKNVSLNKKKLTDLIESTLQRGSSPNLAYNDDKKAFFISDDQIRLKFCSC